VEEPGQQAHFQRSALARKSGKKPANEAKTQPTPLGFSTAAQITTFPDVWALALRLKVDGHPFGMKGREFQRDIIRDESEWIIMPKGAQMGLTTIFLVRTFIGS
jgi:hypothetical protein